MIKKIFHQYCIHARFSVFFLGKCLNDPSRYSGQSGGKTDFIDFNVSVTLPGLR